MLPVHHDVAVLTPDKVVVTYRVAAIGTRVWAHLLDLAILAVAIYAVAMAIAITRVEVLIVPAMFCAVLGPFAYFIVLEALWNGQTVGKKAFSLRVRMADGTPVTFGGAALRNLMRPGDFLPGGYLVGLAAIFLSPLSQRLGDMFAGTMVTYEPRARAGFTVSPHTAGVHPYEDQVGELRRMTQEEYFLIKRLCDRFPELSDAAQVRALREVWEPFVARHSVPALPGVHPVYQMEAVVMRYGRARGLL
jgi:uncharacterized RDD family membrane protein YckC